MHPQDGEALPLSSQETSDIIRTALEYAEHLWTVCQAKGFVSANSAGGWDNSKNFRSVFCSPTDCALLRSSLLAALANVTATANSNAAQPTAEDV
jgi:hypothetical protein